MKPNIIPLAVLATALCSIFVGPAYAADQSSTAVSVFASIATATTIDLIELSPSDVDAQGNRVDPSTPHTIGGYMIVAEARLQKSEEIMELAESIKKGIAGAGLGDIALCFSLRHALRLRWGSNKEAALVVCFHCHQGYAKGVYGVEGFAVLDSPQKSWDALFQQHGLLKPKKG